MHLAYLYVPPSNAALFNSSNETAFLRLLKNIDSLYLCDGPGSVNSDRLNEMNIQFRWKSSTCFLF